MLYALGRAWPTAGGQVAVGWTGGSQVPSVLLAFVAMIDYIRWAGMFPLTCLGEFTMAKISNTSKGAKQDKGTHYVVQPFTSFEVNLYGACRAIEAASFEVDSKRTIIVSMIKVEYPNGMTFDQYRDLQEALKLQALADGFTGRAMRTHVAEAVKTVFGELPVSDSPAAILKAKARAIKAAAAKKNAPAVPATSAVGKDTLAGNAAPLPHRAGPQETIEQFIARVGITATINALARILETDNANKVDAIALRAIAAHVNAPKAGELKAA